MNRVGAGQGTGDWITAHETLTRLAKRRAALDWEEGGALLAAARARVHEYLGHGSFAEYVERLLGYSPRTTEEKLRTAQALERLPELAHALHEGAVSWSVVRELTRVATPETERAWLEAAAGKRARQVEQLVSGRSPGDRPTDPARPEARRHVLRFDVSAETFATFREAVAHLRRQSQDPLDDDSLLLLLAREILQGPTDTGRASYQVAVARAISAGAASSKPPVAWWSSNPKSWRWLTAMRSASRALSGAPTWAEPGARPRTFLPPSAVACCAAITAAASCPAARMAPSWTSITSGGGPRAARTTTTTSSPSAPRTIGPCIAEPS